MGSLAQDSDLPRESALESFQRAAHIAKRYQQIFAEISCQ